jgi:hypothetical protein
MRQDQMGLEIYIEMCRRNWVGVPWWIWIFPLLGVSIAAWFLAASDE